MRDILVCHCLAKCWCGLPFLLSFCVIVIVVAACAPVALGCLPHYTTDCCLFETYMVYYVQ